MVTTAFPLLLLLLVLTRAEVPRNLQTEIQEGGGYKKELYCKATGSVPCKFDYKLSASQEGCDT